MNIISCLRVLEDQRINSWKNKDVSQSSHHHSIINNKKKSIKPISVRIYILYNLYILYIVCFLWYILLRSYNLYTLLIFCFIHWFKTSLKIYINYWFNDHHNRMMQSTIQVVQMSLAKLKLLEKNMTAPFLQLKLWLKRKGIKFLLKINL